MNIAKAIMNRFQTGKTEKGQVYFCDRSGQTHALYARVTVATPTMPEGRCYRVATMDEGRTNPWLTIVGQTGKYASSNFAFIDEGGRPVDIRERHERKGLFFFNRSREEGLA